MTTLDLGRLPRGQSGQLIVGQTGKSPLWKTLSGDATLSSAGALTLAAGFQAHLAPSAFSVHKNAVDQTGVADFTQTQVTWPTELYDVGSHFASNVWTPPAGKVFLTASVIADATITAGALVGIGITKNGATTVFKQTATGATTSVGCASITCEDIAAGTDAYGVAFVINVDSGTATIRGAATDTYFMGHWISA